MNQEYKRLSSLCPDDYSLGVGSIDVYFRNQREHLLRHLAESEIVVGAISESLDWESVWIRPDMAHSAEKWATTIH